jgi:hypothetical protein
MVGVHVVLEESAYGSDLRTSGFFDPRISSISPQYCIPHPEIVDFYVEGVLNIPHGSFSSNVEIAFTDG